MVLVAPSPMLEDAALEHGATGRDAAHEGSRHDVLALLRGDVSTRPSFDPGLAAGLRAWLEDAAYHATTRRGEDTGALVLGSRQLLGSSDAPGPGPGAPELAGRLVHALFRQLVHGVAVGSPLDDALDALRAGGDEVTTDEVEALSATARDALAGTLVRHLANLERIVPRFAPGWMPRTDDYVAIPLAGGRVVLRGVFDLLVGVPRSGTASLCALGLSTGGSWARERRSLHFLALLHLLRAGSPPFRVALFESQSGRYGVEDVRENHLRAMTAHVAAALECADAGHA
jgi:hypothetical protein